MSAAGRRAPEQLDPTAQAIVDALHAVARRINEREAAEFQSVQGILVRGARVVPIASGGPQLVSAVSGGLVGWAVWCSDPAANGQLNIRDGIDATGDLIAPITLQPGESTRDHFGPAGLAYTKGLFLEFSGGAISGAVFLQGAS